MSLQMIFLAIFCIAFVVIIFYFLKMNNRLRVNHRMVVNELVSFSEINQHQIYLRDENLNRYNFLKYNLGDVLIMQKTFNFTLHNVI